MRVTILGRSWEFRYSHRMKDDSHGRCDSPKTKSKEIVINASLPPTDRQEAILHELLHAAFWQIDEAEIEQAAHDITREQRRLRICLAEDKKA